MCSLTSSTEQEGPARIFAGRVGRPHGLDGSFHVTAGRPRLLQPGIVVQVGERRAAIERRAGTDRAPIVRLQGVADRDVAEQLRGLPITVAVADAPELPEGEWWAHELEGCSVRDACTHVGVVSRLVELPSCEALEVRREDGGVLLVPMVRDAIRHIDVPGGDIEIDLEFLGESR